MLTGSWGASGSGPPRAASSSSNEARGSNGPLGQGVRETPWPARERAPAGRMASAMGGVRRTLSAARPGQTRAAQAGLGRRGLTAHPTYYSLDKFICRIYRSAYGAPNRRRRSHPATRNRCRSPARHATDAPRRAGRDPTPPPVSPARLGIPRQRLNYHLKALEQCGLLECVEERRKGNCTERILRATARSFVISPDALGTLGPTPESARDRFSASYVVAVAARTITRSLIARRSARAPRTGASPRSPSTPRSVSRLPSPGRPLPPN